jgi:hypothetical protein
MRVMRCGLSEKISRKHGEGTEGGGNVRGYGLEERIRNVDKNFALR